MSKITGLNANLLIDGYDVSGDITAVDTLESIASTLVATGINKLAVERLVGKVDSRIGMSSWFNPTGAHVPFSDLPATDRIVSVLVPAVVGGVSASALVKQINYGNTVGQDGSFTQKVDAEGSGGIQLAWGHQLTAGTDNFTSGGNTSSYDRTAASTGGSLWVHCSAFTGTNVVVALQQSSDNGSGDAFAALSTPATLTFTGIGAQRVAVGSAVTVERYVRANISGTFSNADLAILYVPGPLS